jgi:hypothetical protein
LDVTLKTGKKKVLLIFELRVQARLVDAGGLFQVLNCRVREAMLPKDRDCAIQHTFTIELFRSSHAPSAIKELICAYR